MRIALVTLALTLSLTAVAQAGSMPEPKVTVIHAACPDNPDAGGCTLAYDGIIYVASPDRFVLAHEMGHVFDYQVLTESDRAWFTRLFGMTGPWVTDNAGDAMPAEIFADAYANCHLHLKRVGQRKKSGPIMAGSETAYGYNPSPRQFRRACNAISVLGYLRLSHA